MFNLSNCHTESAADFGRYLFREYSDSLDSLEDAAQTSVEAIYDQVRDDDGHRAFSLVRIFRTCHYSELAPDLKKLATTGSEYWLALMGTIGDEVEWSNRKLSRQHRLISPSATGPMFRAAEEALGLTWGVPVSAAGRVEFEEQAWGTRSFFVPDALGSPVVPEQDFVKDYGIYSVIGLGGRFMDGSSVLTIAFANRSLSPECRMHFAEITPYLMTLLSGYNERGVLWR